MIDSTQKFLIAALLLTLPWGRLHAQEYGITPGRQINANKGD
jgi:hypothetical protein